MLEQGENPKIVQEILGYSQITHTMDTYSHVTPDIQRGAFAGGSSFSRTLHSFSKLLVELAAFSG